VLAAMATSPIDVPGEDEENVDEPQGVRDLVRRSFITGTAIILPLAVTLMIVGFVVNVISNNLDPLATVVQGLPFVAAETSPDAIKLVAVVGLLSVIFLLGFVAEFSKRGVEFSEAFDEFMASLPGIGSVYTSFDEMSDILLDSDTESFQDVKLVEYPGEDSYTVAFKTAETPTVIESNTENEDMVTLFMPMAPNPVMGGFVIHVSKERVVDVDMSVEQGIRSIVTSGVAIGADSPEMRGLTRSEMRELGQIERVERQLDPGADRYEVGGSRLQRTRVDEYDSSVDPEYSDTPDDVADRERSDRDREPTETVPEEAATRDADARETTTTTPAEAAGRSHAEVDLDGTSGAARDRDGEAAPDAVADAAGAGTNGIDTGDDTNGTDAGSDADGTDGDGAGGSEPDVEVHDIDTDEGEEDQAAPE
jgi:uncharacterized membrane protein